MPVVIATEMRVLAAQLERGEVVRPSERTVNLVREAADRIIHAHALP